MSTSKLFKSFVEWLLLPPAYTPLIVRCLGLLALPMGLIVYTWTRGGPGPTSVAAWRIGGNMLQFPMPEQAFANVWFVAGIISCIALIVGSSRKWIVGFLFLSMFYFASRDLMASSPHYIVLECCYLFAILLDCKGRSPSRRLIQLTVFGVYFISAVNKALVIYWMSGDSLRSVCERLMQVKPYLAGLGGIDLGPQWVWMLLSWSVVALEGFIAFALFSRRFRKWALWLGCVFHVLISVLIEPILTLFWGIMAIGWLAFGDENEWPVLNRLNGKKATEKAKGEEEAKAEEDAGAQGRQEELSAKSKSHPIVVVLSIFYLCVVFGVPLRTFFWAGRPIHLQTSFERMPWSYHMFAIGSDVTKSVKIEWTDESGELHSMPAAGRLATAYTDNEAYAIVNYIFDHNANVKSVRIELETSLRNGRATQRKIVTADCRTNLKEPLVEIFN